MLSTSLYRMFPGLIQNNRQPLQPPAPRLNGLLSEAGAYHVNTMTACTFAGDATQLRTELKKFFEYTKIDELMVTSPIYGHEAKLHSLEIGAEVAGELLF